MCMVKIGVGPALPGPMRIFVGTNCDGASLHQQRIFSGHEIEITRPGGAERQPPQRHRLAQPAPEAFGAVSKGWLVPLVVLIAPVGEEVVFRGWLTGRVRALWLLGCALVAGALLAMVSTHVAEIPASFGVVAMGLVAPGGWWWLRRRGVPRWFESAFPALLALSVAVFGLSHLTNYPQISWALLPMILPQVWAGLVLSYARMRIGLSTGIPQIA